MFSGSRHRSFFGFDCLVTALRRCNKQGTLTSEGFDNKMQAFDDKTNPPCAAARTPVIAVECTGAYSAVRQHDFSHCPSCAPSKQYV